MMVHKTAGKHRGGAPRKAPNGLSRVLYVRASEELLAALDAKVAQERDAHPGRGVSRADVARELLYRGLTEDTPANEDGEIS